MSSPIRNACVIRVTNKCDQQCVHCCFRSGPSEEGSMSPVLCEKVNAWIPKNITITIMGGEFTILENYQDILLNLARGRKQIRLVTNGWGIKHNYNKFMSTIELLNKSYGTLIEVAISNDNWHNRKADDEISKLRNDSDLFQMVNVGELKMVPVGRAWDNNILSRYDNQCGCIDMCNMTMIENGMVCKCPFGYFPFKYFHETTWEEARKDILEWRLKEISNGMTCNGCMKKIDVIKSREGNLFICQTKMR